MRNSFASRVLVEGEAGIGKTRLVLELLEEARRASATVVRGRCYQHLNLAYLPLRDSLFPVLEVAALRGPTIVELAIGTPRPYDRSPLMDIIQKVLDGGYDAFDDDEFESSA